MASQDFISTVALTDVQKSSLSELEPAINLAQFVERLSSLGERSFREWGASVLLCGLLFCHVLLVSRSSTGLVRLRRGRLRRGAPFAAVATAAPREQFHNGRRGLFLRLHSSDGDSFSVSQRLLCNFHQTRRV